MTFDNSKTIISLRIKLFVATILFIGYIILAYAAKIIKFPVFGLSDIVWTLILVALWLIISFLPMVLNYQYVSYSDEGESIVFRFFTTGIVGGKKNSVEINKSVFAGYTTESKLLGLSKSLILFQKVGQGTAKYPPIYITALSRRERAKLFSSLNSYVPKV
jgi:hypothetical protein